MRIGIVDNQALGHYGPGIVDNQDPL